MSDDRLLDGLLSLPTVLRVKISPDRRWAAFVWYRVHENADVFVVPTDGSAPPVALTHTPEETQLVGWFPDSRAVIVAEDHDGDERVRLFRVALERPNQLEPLTEDRPPYFLRGGEVAPDGQALYYGMNYDVAAGATLEPTWIYRHDLASGERAAVGRPTKPCWGYPRLSPDGARLVYPRKERHPSGMQVGLIDLAAGEEREILCFADAAKTFARWLDAGRLLVLSEATEAGPQPFMSLGVYELAAGTMRWLISSPERSLESAWVTPEGLVVVDEVRGARHSAAILDPATWAETPFPAVEGNALPLGQAPDGSWLALHYSSTSPADLVRVEVADGETRLSSLTRVAERTALELGRLARAEDFRWKSVDGLEIQGWLYRATPNPRRAVIYVHGGPTAHSEEKINPQIQYLVARGFNVLDVNYRGSTGFGLGYREAIKEDGWGGREQADIAEGAKALIAAGLAAPGCVGVTGTSYGGYSSWCQITHTPREVVAAAAPICGMTDLEIDYRTTRPDLRPYSEEMIGGTPDAIPEKYRARSPINYVEQIGGKLLIVQGAQDPNVTPENVRLVVERLDAAKVPYQVLEFADEGHGIHRPANQAALYRRLVDFFGEALEHEG